MTSNTVVAGAGGAIQIEERGCGWPTAGGIYVRMGFGPGGRQVEEFLIDPPILVPPGLNLSARETRLVRDPKTGVYNILDIVGETNYPDLYGYIREVGRQGLHRKLNPTMDFSLLSKESRIFQAHRKAWIANWYSYSHDERDGAAHLNDHFVCPLPREPWGALHIHAEMCVGMYEHDLLRKWPAGHKAGTVVGGLGGTPYVGWPTPQGVVPEYKTAFFAAFPVSAIWVYKDEAGGSHEAAYAHAAKAKKNGVRVQVVGLEGAGNDD